MLKKIYRLIIKVISEYKRNGLKKLIQVIFRKGFYIIKNNLQSKTNIKYIKMHERLIENFNKDERFFKEFKQYNIKQFSVKIIAFYLPQFHPITENDIAWGQGFTEWTNVTKSIPNYIGHYQPRLPIDLGFYDLRLVDNIRKQCELAINYGLYGFCFHHYWFDGRPIMRTPIDLLLHNKNINIKYCINWANENWTKRWDGRDDEIILKQNHCDEDDLRFIEDASKYLSDSRYIRIKNKPLLMIYRPGLFPNIKKTIDIWRNWYSKHYDEDLYIIMTNSFDDFNPHEYGFDAVLYFSPNRLNLDSINHRLNIINKNFSGKVVDYKDYIVRIKNSNHSPYRVFRSICPSWDNTPRRRDNPFILHGSSPELFKEGLMFLLQEAKKNLESEECFVFINAWNEWGEGAYLEPDRKFGYAYLQVIREILDRIEDQ